MNIKLYWFITLFLSFEAVPVCTQPTFVNKTRQFKKEIPTRSVMPGAIMDIDGDLVDDMILVDRGIWLKAVRSYGKNFSLQLIDTLKVSSNPEWTLTSGDLNNDGLNEIITSGIYNLISISTLKNNKFTKKGFQSGIYAQASNTVDINNDGWLDYFVCNDDGPNKIYLNDKSGNLVLSDVIDFTKNDTTDGSGNYGSEWVDVNGDLLPDLCISKCRAGVSDPADLRRINRLYINNGNGSFTERGAEFRLNNGAQSWVTAFGDIDNDGDQDAFVVNHYSPHNLMENIDGKYFEEIPLPEVMESFGFQSVMRDFDNDGLIDVIIAGVEGVTILHNTGNKTFSIIKNIIGPNLARSVTIGDLNDDGFLDIHAHINEPINEIGAKDDELWLNSGNANNYVKINLEGNVSNRSGIGAQVEIYGVWGKQVRYVKGGESYGIFNSLQQHFGLGSATIIDSLVIRWPSGQKDIYLNPEPNNTYLAQENKCISKSPELYQNELTLTGNPLFVSVPDQYSSYLWNNGATNARIQVTQPGKYHVTMTDAAGCKTISKPVSVTSGCFPAAPKLITESVTIKLCAGESIEIGAIKAAAYDWSTGSTSAIIKVDQSQKILLTATDFCGNIAKDSVIVEFFNISCNVKGDTVKVGEQAVLISDKKSTNWYSEPDAQSPVFTGDTLVTDALSSTIRFFARSSEVIDQKMQNVGEKDFPVNNLYGGNNTVGSIIFNVESSCVLHSVRVNTDTEALRKIIIKNNKGEVIFSKDCFIPAGIHSIVLDAELQPGTQYQLTTDENTNLHTLGYKAPRLVRQFNDTSYPYSIDNIITLLSSPFGAIYYYYFYDWEVYYDIVNCESETKEVMAVVEKDSGLSDQEENGRVNVYPNPTKDIVNIRWNDNINMIFAEITDIRGQKIRRMEKNGNNFDVSGMSDGLYIINVYTDSGLFSFKIIKN